jgi:hypothetical protein
VRRPLGRRGHEREDKIGMYLGEAGLGVANWIYLVQDGDRWQAVVNTVTNILVP